MGISNFWVLNYSKLLYEFCYCFYNEFMKVLSLRLSNDDYKFVFIIVNPWITTFPDILNVETLPQSKPEVEEIVSYGWSIETKYYTADVKLCLTKKRTIGNQDFANSVQAFVVYFDTDKVCC